PQAVFEPSFLDVVGPLEILGRMLANLERAALMANDLEMVEWILGLALVMPSADFGVYRRRAKVLAGLGRVADAAALWERLAGEARDDDVIAHAAQAARDLRASLN
ncbi:MAG: hypothetical protein HYR89_07030, partial [Actinobacteria bacterium]|nr:hypothetical protein [Actinomycetota bacterium]